MPAWDDVLDPEQDRGAMGLCDRRRGGGVKPRLVHS
jgi:hypothetical protein